MSGHYVSLDLPWYETRILNCSFCGKMQRLGNWVARWLKSEPATDWAIAVNLLFSYVNPVHERAIGDYLSRRFSDLPISLSHEVAPIWREYERATTVITDAFIKRTITQFSGRLAPAT